MAKIIIYYSQSGKTDLIARVLGNRLNADLVRIHDLKNREGFKNKLFPHYHLLEKVKLILYLPVLI